MSLNVSDKECIGLQDDWTAQQCCIKTLPVHSQGRHYDLNCPDRIFFTQNSERSTHNGAGIPTAQESGLNMHGQSACFSNISTV